MELYIPDVFLGGNCTGFYVMMSPTSSSLVSTSEYVGKVVLSWYVSPLYEFSVCSGRGYFTTDEPFDIDPQGVFWTGDRVGLLRMMSPRILST